MERHTNHSITFAPQNHHSTLYMITKEDRITQHQAASTVKSFQRYHGRSEGTEIKQIKTFSTMQCLV